MDNLLCVIWEFRSGSGTIWSLRKHRSAGPSFLAQLEQSHFAPGKSARFAFRMKKRPVLERAKRRSMSRVCAFCERSDLLAGWIKLITITEALLIFVLIGSCQVPKNIQWYGVSLISK